MTDYITNKRAVVFCGHYGSGKTNLAVNFAFRLHERGDRVLIADLDIVNPYFRTKDSEKELAASGIELICSSYANSNLDIPALPSGLYRLTQDKSRRAVLDVGGDDSGAVALGRYAPALLEENDFEMIFTANFFRPLTRTAVDAYGIMKEIEKASGMPFTAIVNNSNLGNETTAFDVMKTDERARELSALSGLPVIATSAEKRLCGEINGVSGVLFPLTLQKKVF